MTVIVGFVGPDGAVMASDSEATEGNDGTRYDVDKIWVSSGLLLGYTGYDAVKQPLRARLDSDVTALRDDRADRWAIRSCVRQAAEPALLESYRHFVPTGQHESAAKIAGAVLVAGRDQAGFWLAELDHNNNWTFLDDRGCHALGSGSVAAQVAMGLLGHYAVRDRSAWHLKLVAYRAVRNCINVLGTHGVGGEVRLWYAEGDAAVSEMDGAEREAIEHGLEQWEAIERESLTQVLAPGEPIRDAASEPLPEPLDPAP